MRAFRIIKLVFTIAVILAVVIFIRRIDLKQVADILKGSNKLVLSTAVICVFISILFKMLRFYFIIRYYRYKLSLAETSLTQIISISLATLTPARIGEGIKIILLKKKGIPTKASIKICIFERVFDIVFLGICALLFALFIIKNQKLIYAIFLLIVGLIIVLFKVKAERIELTGLLLISIMTVLVWVFEAFLPWLFLVSINIHLPLLLVIGITSISTLSVVFSFLPAGIGSMDLSILFLYTLIGISTEAATSVLLVTRLFGTLLPFLLCLFLLNFIGQSSVKNSYNFIR